jgi:hypothetical protein
MSDQDIIDTIAAGIRRWLRDELKRNEWNIPDRYAEWFDEAEMAEDGVLTALRDAGYTITAREGDEE